MSTVQLNFYGPAVFVPAFMTLVSSEISDRVARVVAERFKFSKFTDTMFSYGLMLSLSFLSHRKITPLVLRNDEIYSLALKINGGMTLFITFIHFFRYAMVHDIIGGQLNQGEEWTSVRFASKFFPQKSFDESIQQIDDLFKRPTKQSILIQADSASPYHALIQECARRIYEGDLPTHSALKGRSLFYLRVCEFEHLQNHDVIRLVNFYESKNAIVVLDNIEELIDRSKCGLEKTKALD